MGNVLSGISLPSPETATGSEHRPVADDESRLRNDNDVLSVSSALAGLKQAASGGQQQQHEDGDEDEAVAALTKMAKVRAAPEEPTVTTPQAAATSSAASESSSACRCVVCGEEDDGRSPMCHFLGGSADLPNVHVHPSCGESCRFTLPEYEVVTESSVLKSQRRSPGHGHGGAAEDDAPDIVCVLRTVRSAEATPARASVPRGAKGETTGSGSRYFLASEIRSAMEAARHLHARRAATTSDNVVAPSIVPHEQRSDETTRPAKMVEDAAVATRKESHVDVVLSSPSKEGIVSMGAATEAVASSQPQKGNEGESQGGGARASSPTAGRDEGTSAAKSSASVSSRRGDNDDAPDDDDAKKDSLMPPLPSSSMPPSSSSSWVCSNPSCGKSMPPKRKRCTECRGWKGGKRDNFTWSTKKIRKICDGEGGGDNVGVGEAVASDNAMKAPVMPQSSPSSAATSTPHTDATATATAIATVSSMKAPVISELSQSSAATSTPNANSTVTVPAPATATASPTVAAIAVVAATTTTMATAAEATSVDEELFQREGCQRYGVEYVAPPPGHGETEDQRRKRHLTMQRLRETAYQREKEKERGEKKKGGGQEKNNHDESFELRQRDACLRYGVRYLPPPMAGGETEVGRRERLRSMRRARDAAYQRLRRGNLAVKVTATADREAAAAMTMLATKVQGEPPPTKKEEAAGVAVAKEVSADAWSYRSGIITALEELRSNPGAPGGYAWCTFPALKKRVRAGMDTETPWANDAFLLSLQTMVRKGEAIHRNEKKASVQNGFYILSTDLAKTPADKHDEDNVEEDRDPKNVVAAVTAGSTKKEGVDVKEVTGGEPSLTHRSTSKEVNRNNVVAEDDLSITSGSIKTKKECSNGVATGDSPAVILASTKRKRGGIEVEAPGESSSAKKQMKSHVESDSTMLMSNSVISGHSGIRMAVLSACREDIIRAIYIRKNNRGWVEFDDMKQQVMTLMDPPGWREETIRKALNEALHCGDVCCGDSGMYKISPEYIRARNEALSILFPGDKLDDGPASPSVQNVDCSTVTESSSTPMSASWICANQSCRSEMSSERKRCTVCQGWRGGKRENYHPANKKARKGEENDSGNRGNLECDICGKKDDMPFCHFAGQAPDGSPDVCIHTLCGLHAWKPTSGVTERAIISEDDILASYGGIPHVGDVLSKLRSAMSSSVRGDAEGGGTKYYLTEDIRRDIITPLVALQTQKTPPEVDFFRYEARAIEECRANGVDYEPPVENETVAERRLRLDRMSKRRSRARSKAKADFSEEKNTVSTPLVEERQGLPMQPPLNWTYRNGIVMAIFELGSMRAGHQKGFYTLPAIKRQMRTMAGTERKLTNKLFSNALKRMLSEGEVIQGDNPCLYKLCPDLRKRTAKLIRKSRSNATKLNVEDSSSDDSDYSDVGETKHGGWSKREEKLFAEGFELYGHAKEFELGEPFAKIAAHIKSRTPRQVYEHYRIRRHTLGLPTISRTASSPRERKRRSAATERDTNESSPSDDDSVKSGEKRHGYWSDGEEESFLKAFELYGQGEESEAGEKLGKMASHIKSRTPKQVYYYYRQHRDRLGLPAISFTSLGTCVKKQRKPRMQADVAKSSFHGNEKVEIRQGYWTKDEEERFLKAFELYGQEEESEAGEKIRKMALHVKSRKPEQVYYYYRHHRDRLGLPAICFTSSGASVIEQGKLTTKTDVTDSSSDDDGSVEIKQGYWTEGEEKRFLQAFELYAQGEESEAGEKLQKIASHIKSRRPKQVYYYYRQHRDKLGLPAISFTSPGTGVRKQRKLIKKTDVTELSPDNDESVEIKQGHWSDEEDKRFLEAFELYSCKEESEVGEIIAKMSSHIKTRTVKQIYSYYRNHRDRLGLPHISLKMPGHASEIEVKQSRHETTWSDKEEDLLVKAYGLYGGQKVKWEKIASVVETKTPEQSKHYFWRQKQRLLPMVRVRCDCGGYHMFRGTVEGDESWRIHLMTKKHQKWLHSTKENSSEDIGC